MAVRFVSEALPIILSVVMSFVVGLESDLIQQGGRAGFYCWRYLSNSHEWKTSFVKAIHNFGNWISDGDMPES